MLLGYNKKRVSSFNRFFGSEFRFRKQFEFNITISNATGYTRCRNTKQPWCSVLHTAQQAAIIPSHDQTIADCTVYNYHYVPDGQKTTNAARTASKICSTKIETKTRTYHPRSISTQRPWFPRSRFRPRLKKIESWDVLKKTWVSRITSLWKHEIQANYITVKTWDPSQLHHSEYMRSKPTELFSCDWQHKTV